MQGLVYKVGSHVTTRDGSFSGVVLGEHGRLVGAPAGKMLLDGSNINLRIYMVRHLETGEVRQFVDDALADEDQKDEG